MTKNTWSNNILHRVSTVANALRLHRSYQGFESLTRYHFCLRGKPLSGDDILYHVKFFILF